MTSEVAILRAYALASQGQYADAEALLTSTAEALNTPAGIDLLARIRFEQGDFISAKQLWERVLAIDPSNQNAVRALNEKPSKWHLKKLLEMPKSLHIGIVFILLCVSFFIGLSLRSTSIQEPCIATLPPKDTQEQKTTKNPLIMEKVIPIQSIGGELITILKNDILTHMTGETILVLRGGHGKTIINRQVYLTNVAECIAKETNIPMDKIFLQPSEQETNEMKISIRSY